MADTQTLPLNLPQKEVKKAHPTSVLGGAMGWLNELGELAIKGQGSFVNEGPVTGQDLEQLRQMPELKPGGVPARGSLENFQKPHTLMADEDLIEEQRAAIAEAERILGRNRVKSHEEFVQDEEIRFEVAGMSEAERNKRLHFNLSFRKKHTEGKPYYEAELHRQKIEELRAAQREKQSQEFAVQQQPVVDLNAVLEGGLGKGKAHISPISSAG